MRPDIVYSAALYLHINSALGDLSLPSLATNPSPTDRRYCRNQLVQRIKEQLEYDYNNRSPKVRQYDDKLHQQVQQSTLLQVDGESKLLLDKSLFKTMITNKARGSKP
jgi:hypothetical protein